MAAIAALSTALVLAVQAPSPAAGVQNSGVRAWAIENESPTHTYTQAEAVADAQRFDVITALRGSYRNHVSAMKQANPDLTLLVYMNGAFAQANQETTFPSDWYLRDANGNKVKNNWNIWLMNPAHPGWVANRVQECQNALAYSGYDGCFIDNLGPGAIWGPSLTADPINPSTGRVWTRQEWMNATAPIASQIRGQIAPRPVLVNGLGAGFEYYSPSPTRQLLDAADNGIAEMWLRPAHQPIASYRSEASWKQDVDMLIDAASRGKSVFTSTKIWVDATTAQKEAWHRYALASFLLGDNGSHHFTFSYGRYEDPTAGHDLWNVDLGDPTNAYSKRDGVYQRDFTNGRVLVNPTDAPATVDLGATYTTLDGSSISSLTLQPHSGHILRRTGTAPSPEPTPEPTPAPATQWTFDGNVTAGGTDWRAHTIEVTKTGTINAQLGWSGSANLNLGLRDPSGTWVAWASTTQNPERIQFQADRTGTWTFGVKASSGSGDYRLDVAIDAASNTAPTVLIDSPGDGATVTSSDIVTLRGSATDPEDGVLTSKMTWASDRDGALGVGSEVRTILSPGSHAITASVQDSAGRVSSQRVQVEVTRPTGSVFRGQVDAAGDDWDVHVVDVAKGTRITATLDWTDPSADLNLGLQDPAGSWVAWASSLTERPERLVFDATTSGTWTFGVKGRTGSAGYSLHVTQESAPTTTQTSTKTLAATVDATSKGGARSAQIEAVARVVSGSAPAANALVTVELQSNGRRLAAASASTDTSGNATFRWRKLAPGCYDVVVTSVEPPADAVWDGQRSTARTCL